MLGASLDPDFSNTKDKNETPTIPPFLSDYESICLMVR